MFHGHLLQGRPERADGTDVVPVGITGGSDS